MFSLPIKLWSSLAIIGVIGIVMFVAYLLVDNLRDEARQEGAAAVRTEIAASDAKAQAEAQTAAQVAQNAAAAQERIPGVQLRIRQQWCRDCPEAYK